MAYNVFDGTLNPAQSQSTTVRGQKRRDKIKGRAGAPTAVPGQGVLDNRCYYLGLLDRVYIVVTLVIVAWTTVDDRAHISNDDRRYLVAALQDRVTRPQTTSIIAFLLSDACTVCAR